MAIAGLLATSQGMAAMNQEGNKSFYSVPRRPADGLMLP
jgi:hypothetical protein